MPQPQTVSGRKLEIGLRVKEARQDISMSQEEFSKLMGKSGRHWAWKVEAGQIGLSAEQIPNAAEILGRSVQWLIEGREEVFEVQDPELRLFFRQYEWGDFTNEEQEIVRQGVKMAQAYRAAREQSEAST
ncbi:MAG: helix-turn-helix transcriptional regulator [Dehalococcoidia bacterium]|nr:helix-turn-helix transcriptional regulator [Dehalococcoidia bacterium]